MADHLRKQWKSLSKLVRRITRSHDALHNEPDIEMQTHEPPCWSATLQSFFNLTPEELARFPSIGAYCRYVESQFPPVLDESYVSVWAALHPATPPSPVSPLPTTITTTTTRPIEAADCWKLLHTIASELKSAPRDASIENIKHCAIPRAGHVDSTEEPHASVVVFAAICWLTMILHPSLSFSAPDSSPSLACVFQGMIDGPVYQKQNIREAKRPISRVISAFKVNVWDDQPQHPSGAGDGDENDNLYEGSLTFYALRFGRITVEWVDTLGEHLKFDPVSRRLCLFRFPTYCVLLALRKDTCPALTSISRDFLSVSPDSRYPNYVTLEQEILLSYRLLFGQSSRSQALARSAMLELVEKDELVFDELLHTLCGSKTKVDKLPHEIWPVWCREAESDQLLESDVYSARTDFPRLGYRLIQLQRFSLRQRPSRLTDLWRDRRNPLQWYTFWAVLWVGGAAIVLAVVQIALQAAQLVLSSPQTPAA